MDTTIKRYRNNALRFSYKISEKPTSVKVDTHIYWELILIKKGRGVYTVNGKEYSIAENHLIITRPMDLHAITLEGDEPYERYNFAFERNRIYDELLDLLPADVDVINCSANELMRSLFRKVPFYLEQYDMENLDTQKIEALLIQTIYEILCNLLILHRNEGTGKPDTCNQMVTRAVQYIGDNIAKPLSANDLADYLSVSRRYLEKLFSVHLHTTPKQYIIARKLIMARQDLRAGSTAAEVCEKYAFPDYSGFYRQYVKYFGHKPSDAAKIESYFGMEY